MCLIHVLRFMENEIRIHLLALMDTHIFAAKQMVKQGSGGRMVGAGSIASYRTAKNLGPYGATKFAVRGFTEAVAKEWAQYGIRVNGECTSPVLYLGFESHNGGFSSVRSWYC